MNKIVSMGRGLLLAVVFAGNSNLLGSDADSIDFLARELSELKISSATKYSQTVSNAPASITIINSDEIRDYGFETLSEALEGVAGFYSSYDRAYVSVGVRGFNRLGNLNNRILVLLDGHAVNESLFGSTPFGGDLVINPNIIERIEVIRGPGSVVYGTGAMLAVVNIVSKDGDAVSNCQIAGSLGSRGARSTTGMAIRELGNKTQLLVSGVWGSTSGNTLFFPEFNQLATNYGVAEGKDWERRNGIMVKFTGNSWKLFAYTSNRRKGVPTAFYGTDFNSAAAWVKDNYSGIDFAYQRNILPQTHLLARIYADNYREEGIYPYDGRSDFEIGQSRTIGSELQVDREFGSRFRLLTGVDCQKSLELDYTYANELGDIYYQGTYDRNVISAFAHAEYQPRHNVILSFGLRHDDYSHGLHFTTPRGAIVFHPTSKASVKLVHGAAFRVPNPYELDYDDPVSGYKANSSLEPEEIRTTELTWEQKLTSCLSGSISAFDNQIRGLIEYVMDPADNFLQNQNLDNVNSRGMEFQIQARLSGGFNSYLNYSVQKTTHVGSSEQITNSPQNSFKAGASFSLMRHFIFSTQWRYENGRTTLLGAETASYSITDLNLVIAPRITGPSTKVELMNSLRLTLKVSNLFDSEYDLPGSYEHAQNAIAQDGRKVTVTLSKSF